MKTYFLVYFGEDGMCVTKYTKPELDKFLAQFTDDEDIEFLPDFTYLSMDGGEYPMYSYCIIEGEIKVPEMKVVKKEYRL